MPPYDAPMILNHQHRFLFIHVPKTAGTTVTRSLSRLTTFRDIELGGTKYGESLQNLFAARFDLRKHSTGQAIKAKCPPHLWRSFFVFAFVRNPYARAYSIYRFLQRWKEGPHHGMIVDLDFAGFLSCGAVQDGTIEIARPQVHWLAPDGQILPGLDFVGRVERFAEDFSFVLSVIHRRREAWADTRHDNSSAGVDEWRSHMTAEAKALIEDLYAQDFLVWGYDRLPDAANAA